MYEETSSAAGNLSRLEVRDPVSNHFADVIVDALMRNYVQNHSSTLLTRLSLMSRETFHLQSDIIDEVIQRTSHSIAYVFGGQNQRTRRPRFFNIAFVDGIRAFELLFRALDPLYNDFSGYYLIVLTTFGRLLPVALQHIFTVLWSISIVNVNVITANLDSAGLCCRGQQVLLYTYYPYRADACEEIVPRLVRRFRAGQPLVGAGTTGELFPDKLSDFYGCRVTVGTFHLPPYVLLRRAPHGGWANGSDPGDYGGMEGDLLRALADKLNFTVHLLVPGDRELWGETEQPTGCVRMVLSGRVNLTLGGYAIQGDRNRVLKHSRSYYNMRLVFAVPPGRPYTPFEKLFRPFTRGTWLLVAVCFALGVTVIVTLELAPRVPGRRVRAFVYGRHVGTPLLNLLGVAFGDPMVRLPGRNFARALLALWLGYCLVMRTLYQGSLFEYLQERKNFSHPQTVERLLAERYRFYAMRSVARNLEQIPAVLERTALLPDDDAYVERHLHRLSSFRAAHGDALLTDVDRVAFHNRLHHRAGYVHIARETVVHLPVGIYYPKQSCLVHAFDRELDHLLMSGLFTRRLRHYVNYDFFHRQPAQQPLPSPLTNDQLIGCYETFATLLLLALGTLLLELGSLRSRPLRRALLLLHSRQ